MLFRDFIGAGGHGTVNDKDVPSGCAARPDNEGAPRTPRIVVSPSVASGAKRCPESSGRIGAYSAPPPADNAHALTPDAAPIVGSA